MKMRPAYIIAVPIVFGLLWVIASVYAQGTSTPGAGPKCWPREAGGVGRNYSATAYRDKGTVYSWYCDSATPQYVVSRSDAVMTGTRAPMLRAELERLYREDYAATHLRAEAAAQLAATKP